MKMPTLWRTIGAVSVTLALLVTLSLAYDLPKDIPATPAVATIQSAPSVETPIARIDNSQVPRQVRVGQLVYISAKQSQGVEFLWIHDITKEVQKIECESGKSLAVVPKEAGRQIIWLVVSGSTGKMDAAFVALNVVEDDLPPGPDPDPPEPDPPTGDLDARLPAVKAQFEEQMRQLDDAETQAEMAPAWRAASGKMRGSPNMADAAKVLKEATEEVLRNRNELSRRYKDWLGLFRVPFDDLIKELVEDKLVTTPVHYAKVVECVAEAMEWKSER